MEIKKINALIRCCIEKNWSNIIIKKNDLKCKSIIKIKKMKIKRFKLAKYAKIILNTKKYFNSKTWLMS